MKRIKSNKMDKKNVWIHYVCKIVEKNNLKKFYTKVKTEKLEMEMEIFTKLEKNELHWNYFKKNWV